VNVKELTDVKTLVDEILELLSESLELIGSELGPMEPDSLGDNDGMAVAGEGNDDAGNTDPLVEVEQNLVRAHSWCADILDITEPHRKRYVAQANGSKRATQLAVQGLGSAAADKAKEMKGVKDGKDTTKKLRFTRRTRS